MTRLSATLIPLVSHMSQGIVAVMGKMVSGLLRIGGLIGRWCLPCLICMGIGSRSLASGAETGSSLGQTLASNFSKDWRNLQQEILKLKEVLDGLPDVSVTNFGGPSGFLSNRNAEEFSLDRELYWLQVQWKSEAVVDLVCLVPARIFDELGLDREYGLPEDFQVLLLDVEGKTLKVLASEKDTGKDTVRMGKPFYYPVDPPLRCAGLKVVGTRTHRSQQRRSYNQFMAWGEIFCFQGEHNIARGATATASRQMRSPWPWSPSFAVDGVTGLGLPELPTGLKDDVGWLSLPHSDQEKPVWVEVDLGEPRMIDGARLFPPERPSGDLIPGFAFPERFVIEGSLTGEEGSYRTVFDHSDQEFENPGHHPVTLDWPRVELRYLRIRSLVLRKVAVNYPAFMGFSEIQVLDSASEISLGCSVSVSENNEPQAAYGMTHWTPASLTDGCTSFGHILSMRRWLELLEERYRIETEIFVLKNRADGIARRFQRGAIVTGGTTGFLMLSALIALPIRYRRREVQKLRQLRAQIAADLHDEIGSSLGGIQMLTESALRKPDGAEERLRSIGILSSASVSSLRDIVWLLRPGSAFQSPALAHFRETASILLEGVEWDFEADAASRACRLARDTNRHLLLFFREALHNSLRHSGCDRILIKTALRENTFVLTVQDDGRGIPAEKMDSPFCLRALKERANRLGGTVEIDSRPGPGTTVILRFPVNSSNSITKP